MIEKNKPEIKLGATVRLKAQSGETITGQVVHMWEEKSVLMVRVASGDLVYNVPAKMLIDERGSK
jgi:transcription elongation GreA/GreB family factor